jgi:hypothetical protein
MAHVAKGARTRGEGDLFPIDGQAGGGRQEIASSGPTLALAVERAVRSVGTAESAEAFLWGLGMAALGVLLGYAILILARFQVGILTQGLG